MSIRSIQFILFFVLSSAISFAQNFEGKILYEVTYKSKMPNVTDQQLTAMMGAVQNYYIKDGNYKSEMNGTLMQWQIYINKDNKLYNKMANSSSVLWNDGAMNPDEVIKAEINKNVTEVLGYTCDELILTCKSGIQKYYFSSKLKVDARLYENHKFGNWSEVVSKTKSLPLKMIIDNVQFTIECIATDVKSMKLEAKLFELPADSKIEKSPY